MKKFLLTIVTFLAIVNTFVFGQDVSSQQNRKRKLEIEIANLEKQLSENKNAQKNKLSTLSLVKRKVDARNELVKASKRELAALNDSVYIKQRQINMLQARLDTMTIYYNRLVKNAYKNRDARIWYMYILASGSLSQATRRYGYLRTLSTQMNIQARKIIEARSQLEQRLVELKALRSKVAKAKASHEKTLASLQKEQKQLTGLISQLQKDKSKYTRALSTKKKQVETLNKEIQRIIAAAMKEGSSAKKSSAKIDYALAEEFESNRGKLPWPVDGGSVVESFGQHTHPVYKSIKMPFNNGVNIAVSRGTAVQAVFKGEVKKIIVIPGYHRCVLVQHGNFFTFYCKLGDVKVKAGQKISTGQIIGTVDTIDDETQLHFELWKGTSRQDPETWLKLL